MSLRCHVGIVTAHLLDEALGILAADEHLQRGCVHRPTHRRAAARRSAPGRRRWRGAQSRRSGSGDSRTLAQGAVRSSDLEFTRDPTPKLLEMARSLASTLPARPSVFHRCASSRRCRDCGRTRSRRPGGRRTPGGAHILFGRRDHPGRRRPGSRRCCSSSHLGRSPKIRGELSIKIKISCSEQYEFSAFS